MFLLPSILMGTFLTIGLTVLAVAVVLIVLFYLMYHTYHGDLPKMMKLIITIFLIVGAVFVLLNYIF